MGAEEDVESGVSWRKHWDIWKVVRVGIDFHDCNERTLYLLAAVNGPVVSISFEEPLFVLSDHRLRRDHSLSFFLRHHILGATGTTRTVGIIVQHVSIAKTLRIALMVLGVNALIRRQTIMTNTRSIFKE